MKTVLTVLLWLSVGSPAAVAQDAGTTVVKGGIPVSCPDRTLGPVMPPVPDRSAAPMIIYARELDAGKTDQSEARGQVEMFRMDQHISTEIIQFNPLTEVVTVPTAVEYEDQQVWIKGKEGEYRLAEESGHFALIDYGLTGSSANGSAELITLTGGNTSLLQGLDYTTCPDENPDWKIYARELTLQHEEGMGTARGAKLEFKGVPILYTPYFSFPIDDRRKSGFLYPTLGHNNDNGLDIGIPWYWNIRPNMDATIEPRYFTNRGFMLSGDYRFLTQKTNGVIDFDYMPKDKKTDEERYHYQFRHNAAPWRRWNTALIVERVSDDRYFQDFGTSLGQTSRQFLRSSARLHGVGRYWNFELMADNFQVLDESVQGPNEPYRRVPRIGFWLDRPLGSSSFYLGLDSELVYFDRDLGVTGARLDLLPRVYWNYHNSWGFVRPSLGYRFTGYELDRNSLPGDDSPSRGTAIASLDAGLIFDRLKPDGGLQTLEPRIFYLYVPYKEQNDFPIFDTGEFTFGFSQLFNTNRFAGGDRQGDANQMSFAVSTRSFDGPSGKALWSLSLGQIVYFESQKVQLDDLEPIADNLSPFIAEFEWWISQRFSTVAGLQWNWERDYLDVGTLGFRYRGRRGERLVFEYRYRQNRVDQFDFRIFWPINERWRVLSRLNYSFADDDLLEFQGGVEYESCCWAVRTVLRRYLKNRDGDYRDSIYIELNLKGLASIGTGRRDLFPN